MCGRALNRRQTGARNKRVSVYGGSKTESVTSIEDNRSISNEQNTTITMTSEGGDRLSPCVIHQQDERNVLLSHEPFVSLKQAVLLPNYMCERYNKIINSEHEHNRRSTRRTYSTKKYSLNLVKVFTQLVLLGFLQLSCAAPPSRNILHHVKRDMNGQMNGTPKWINPCGMRYQAYSPDPDMSTVSNRELLKEILVQAKNALADADAHKDEYVRKTFKVNFNDHHESWKLNSYKWLPKREQIPKDLGEEVAKSHLESLRDLNDTLAASYEYFQRYAAGLEQVANDQRDANGHFKELFNDTEFKLRAVLCEIYVVMIDRNAPRREDITRDIISEEYRNLSDNTHRNLRDWIIFRDYMNALQYFIQVFEYYSTLN